MEDGQNKSADDSLEQERPNALNHSVGEQRLAEDNDPPAAAADDNTDETLPLDHPSQDTGVDESEKYEGEI